MSKLMLIDAVHPEETRVAVVADGQIEDFDFEARDKRQLRGNIYLAKVTRVEPSLQAAFVEYGGNRHGFLAFSEIHPDYYQIPKEDREALLAEEMASARRHDEDDDDDDDDDDETSEASKNPQSSDEDSSDHDDEDVKSEASSRDSTVFEGDEDEGETSHDHDEDHQDDDQVERAPKRLPPSRRYKIQEVIKRRQILLIQVVKEERGNKGAAVTTYLSLAGRYGVLMPNTARGGGISRKISNTADRKRLKKVMGEFDVPEGMGLIIRTAGAKRTKSEISRDYEYLIRLWSNIRNLTLESSAPCLIHEEGNLVLRAIRDLYDRDVDKIIVEGKESYVQAKNVISMLMPDHAHKVIEHDKKTPLFISQGIEPQLDNIYSPVVQLPSGGYLVINQTEALVAVDVNSGKATRERNIETTALKTNLEAAAEVCRQMRLRDLAGLIVIDFIDMEETKNNRAVEKKMKECLSIDRARVQTGRISQFGLFEISRQRRRAGVLELSSEPCKACCGTGRTRSIESAALQLLRAIEERAADKRVDRVSVSAPAEVALYILNHKREAITEMEESTNADVMIRADDELMPGDFAIEATDDGKIVAYTPIVPVDASPKKRRYRKSDDEVEEDEVEADVDDVSTDEEAHDDGDGSDDSNRRRRRGRRGGRRRRTSEPTTDGLEVIDGENAEESEFEEDSSTNKSRRNRRRRPRRRTPDVAVDGGEMMDAVASAPFLFTPPEEDEDEDEFTQETSKQSDGPAEERAPKQERASRNSKRRRKRRRNPDRNTDGQDIKSEDSIEQSISEDEDSAFEEIVAEISNDAHEIVPAFETVAAETSAIQFEEADLRPAPEDIQQTASNEVVSFETTTDRPQEDVEQTLKTEIPSEVDKKAKPDSTLEVEPTAKPQSASVEEEPRLHALHAASPQEEAADEPPKKRRIGWWSKK